MDSTDERTELTNNKGYKTNFNNSNKEEEQQPSSLLSYQHPRQTTTKSRPGRGSGRTLNNNQKTQIGLNSTNTPTSAQAATNIGKPIVHMKENVYQVYFCIMTNNIKKPFSEIQIANVLLKAIQQVDGTTEILTPSSNLHQRLSFTTINPTLSGDIPQNRTFSKIFSTEKQNGYGSLWFTSDLSFPSIGKNQSFKTDINVLGRTTIILNNINANPPPEIGFFIHQLVRHDTIQSQTFLQSFLPNECPPFQQDIVTIWVGTNNTRRVIGVLKIFTDPS